MTVTALLLLASGISGFAAAGLAVDIDQVPEPMQVDGVWVTAQRATGLDIPILARRIESHWRLQGSLVRAMQHDGWSMLTRIQGGTSEVLQWRGSTPHFELLLSHVDLQRMQVATAESTLSLPSGCAWVRSVSGSSNGQRFTQRSARCTRSAAGIATMMQSSLATQGWRVRTAGEAGLMLDRPGAQAVLALSTARSELATWLVWLRVDQTGRSGP